MIPLAATLIALGLCVWLVLAEPYDDDDPPRNIDADLLAAVAAAILPSPPKP